jgi:hypothetical protein
VWIFRDSDAYSGGFPGEDSTVVNGPSWADGADGLILHFVGLEGFELATSEYDVSRTYLVGEELRAPEYDPLFAGGASVHINTLAGVVTNQNVRYGRECIIGIVAPSEYSPLINRSAVGNNVIDENGTKILTFYTTYRPPLENVNTAIVTV